MQSISELAQSGQKKRKADDISQETNEYSNMNQTLAELYHERKKLRANETPANEDEIQVTIPKKEDLIQQPSSGSFNQVPIKEEFKEGTKKIFSLSDLFEKEKSDNVSDFKLEDNKATEISKTKENNFKLPENSDRPLMYLNKLRYYP